MNAVIFVAMADNDLTERQLRIVFGWRKPNIAPNVKLPAPPLTGYPELVFKARNFCPVTVLVGVDNGPVQNCARAQIHVVGARPRPQSSRVRASVACTSAQARAVRRGYPCAGSGSRLAGGTDRLSEVCILETPSYCAHASTRRVSTASRWRRRPEEAYRHALHQADVEADPAVRARAANGA